jgi:hypothetical protein
MSIDGINGAHTSTNVSEHSLQTNPPRQHSNVPSTQPSSSHPHATSSNGNVSAAHASSDAHGISSSRSETQTGDDAGDGNGCATAGGGSSKHADSGGGQLSDGGRRPGRRIEMRDLVHFLETEVKNGGNGAFIVHLSMLHAWLCMCISMYACILTYTVYIERLLFFLAECRASGVCFMHVFLLAGIRVHVRKCRARKSDVKLSAWFASTSANVCVFFGEERCSHK